MKKHFKILAGAVALALTGQVSAVTNWDLTTATVSSGAFGVTSGTVTATATGWANTGPALPLNLNPGVLAQQTATGNMALYSGLGLGINNLDGCASGPNCDVGDIASSAPEHAIDNNQRNEMVLLNFSKSVNLTNVKFGWTGKSNNTSDPSNAHSEYTVMAYTGVAAPTLSGLTWGTLPMGLNTGWVTIGNYADAIQNTSNAITGSNGSINSQYSSYWLIGAYNPLVSGNNTNCYTPGNTSSVTCSSGNDYMKLASVSGTVQTSRVPEPGSLALFGIALLGMLTLRQRPQA